jgi:sigma-B regulation protein RsbU (phosphoserine phosphatase)
MYDLTQASRNYQTMEQILKQLAFETHRLVKVEGAFLLLQMPDGPLLLEHFPRPVLAHAVLQRYLDRVRSSGHELLLDSRTDPGAPFHNLLLMPIHVGGALRATLGLVNKTGSNITAPHIKLARAIAEHAGARIENVLLYEQNLQRARMQTEMELAQNVQLNLLPQESPRIAGLELWAGSRPASQVGGDFYDFILRQGQPFTFTVGDVSGKGMPAAMLMTMMRTVVRAKVGANPGPSPEQVVTRSNEELYDDFTDLSMFATMFIGQYDVDSRWLTYANAGHSPVVFCPVEGGARLLEADGTAIGILPTSFSENQRLLLRPGDTLVVATDGLNEARNAQDELFGYQRLMRLVESLVDQPARSIADALLRTVQSFSAGRAQEDDQTLIVLKGTAE